MRPRCRDDRGVTLVELIVTLAVFGVLSTMLTTSLVATIRGSHDVTGRVAAAASGRTAVDALAKELRLAARVPGELAPPIRVAQSDRVTFTANVDGLELPVLMDVELVGDELVERRHAPSVDRHTGDVVFGTPTQRVLARGVAAGAPVLTYLDADGLDLADASGVVPDIDRARILLVRVDVSTWVNAAGTGRPARVATTVRLLNELSR